MVEIGRFEGNLAELFDQVHLLQFALVFTRFIVRLIPYWKACKWENPLAL